jgi:hypothetical protein
MMKRLFAAFAISCALAVTISAQITVPNTLVTGTVIKAGDLNLNFSTIANHALDRLTGGNLSGNVTADPGITIDGIDVGATVCVACAPTFKDLTLASPATGLTVAGNVIVNAVGKIPAITSTYFSTLDGTALTGVAQLGTANTFTARNDFLTYTETKVTMGGVVINLATGTHFTYINTAAPTFTVSNPPASGKAGSFTLVHTAAPGAAAPVWTSLGTVRWAGGTPPTVTLANGKTDILTFITYDGGSTWFGLVVGQNF